MRTTPGWPEAVVEVLVPLGTEDARRQRVDLAGGERCDGGVAPEAHLAVARRHQHGVVAVAVHREDGAVDRVLGTAAVRGRAEARVTPRAGPHVGQRIDLGVGVRLLVADQRAVRRAGAVDAVLPARLPEAVVAAEDGDVHAGGARRLDVRSLGARLVLVVTHRHEDAVLEQLRAVPIGIHAGEVADVVAVALEPPHHRVLGVEEPGQVRAVREVAAARRERAVVAHLVGTAGGRSEVEAVAAVGVVGLPGEVRGLIEEIGGARVVAHHEDDVARAAVLRIFAHELGDVDARGARRRNAPRRRYRPVAAVDETGADVGQALRLALRQRHGGLHGRDQARAEAAVVADAIDVETVVGRRRVRP